MAVTALGRAARLTHLGSWIPCVVSPGASAGPLAAGCQDLLKWDAGVSGLPEICIFQIGGGQQGNYAEISKMRLRLGASFVHRIRSVHHGGHFHTKCRV